jgi:hypothetical protein
LVYSLVRGVLAGCYQSLLLAGPSRRYLRHSFLRCLALNPDGPTECTCLFLPRCHRPSPDPSWVGFPFLPRTRFFCGEVSRLSSDISYVQASEFACLPDRSHRCKFRRGPRLLLPGGTCFVASARTGYAIRLIQAIDGERTFTFPDLRSCRLLQRPSLISRIVTQTGQPFGMPSFAHDAIRTRTSRRIV